MLKVQTSGQLYTPHKGNSEACNSRHTYQPPHDGEGGEGGHEGGDHPTYESQEREQENGYLSSPNI